MAVSSWKSAAFLWANLVSAAVLQGVAHDGHPSTFLPSIADATWLSSNLGNSNLVAIDLRESTLYAAGHIPGSINIPHAGTPLWSSNGPNSTLVFPSADVVVETLSKNGIAVENWAVIVSDATQLPSHMAIATRAAATLRYTGLPITNIAILDGGYPAWAAANLSVSTAPAKPRPEKKYTGKINGSFVVERDYVRACIGKVAEGIVLIDARAAADYRAGHIESAVSLPTLTIWNAAGIWKSSHELQQLFEAAVGRNTLVGKNKGEIVVYCRTGILASAWVYALTNILKFENVKLYDGSMEDWTRNGEAVTPPE
ncbi:Rhodanese-like domain-containing protein [Rhypophila decipiens]|uniref:Rhodanese-like domain-containing protein n=1 Tax=Rhypophila decipiens TaxID=261697 RepID=A0AAN7B1N3_9PEZI|nr:Rhodanese-like domain-containing protein [Rhypophila decipiens]